ncbi:helix-turn-helix transcriptional regulator [uncultured Oscillibacter sp.]|uniref:helix-turn-helix domain-containing protein n=1 Tax=uncultured Oscillibacter sp. TaxID=876091 RepID=UPI003439CE01
MLYDNFIERCKEKGVTPSAVMRTIGRNKSSASYWKKGTIPSSDTLQKAADYFGVSVDCLLDINPLPLKEARLETGRRVTPESDHQGFPAT